MFNSGTECSEYLLLQHKHSKFYIRLEDLSSLILYEQSTQHVAACHPAPLHFDSTGTGAMLIALCSAAVVSNKHDRPKYELRSAANNTQCSGFCL